MAYLYKEDIFPIDDGFKIALEYDCHEGSMMLWPTRNDEFRNKCMYAKAAFAKIASIIVKYEKLIVFVNKENIEEARSFLPKEVIIEELAYSDCWIRDIGPTFVKTKKEIRALDFKFNGYKQTYKEYHIDDKATLNICKYLFLPLYREDKLSIDASLFESNSDIVFLIRNSLDFKKNKHHDFEEELMKMLNVNKVIYFEDGLYNDYFKAIENVIKFVSKNKVLLAWTTDNSNPYYDVCRKIEEVLKENKINCVKVLIPSKIRVLKEEEMNKKTYKTYDKNEILPASYVNSYILNGCVIIPKYADELDELALKTYQELFPDRKIIQVYAKELLLALGGIHTAVSFIPKI